jgi:mannose-6-phosphate isomerase-like protein (cupin superfamily)
MQIFTYDRDEHAVSGYDSVALHATRVAQFTEYARATCLTVGPDGLIGTHPAGSHQVLLIVAGSGWVSGSDGVRVPVSAGQGVYWEPGEVHTTGSENGLTAIALEGGPVSLFEPEPESEPGQRAEQATAAGGASAPDGSNTSETRK